MIIKLSSAQKHVLKEMRNGVILHHMQGLNARCFLARSCKTVSWPTIYKLESLNLVIRTDKQIELTELGKTIKL